MNGMMKFPAVKRRFAARRILAAALAAVMTLCLAPASAFGAGETAGSVTYTVIPLPSAALNGDIVWGAGQGVPSADNLPSGSVLDDCGVFYAHASDRNNGSGGLPLDGRITVDGVPYQLASGSDPAAAYDGKDGFRLHYGDKTATMQLATPAKFSNIFVFATAGGVGTGSWEDMSVTLKYSDSTSATVTYRLYDWWEDRTDNSLAQNGGVAVKSVSGYKRFNIKSSDRNYLTYEQTYGVSSPPYIHSAMIPSDATKTLSEITFTVQGSSSLIYTGIFAVTGALATNPPATPVAVSATDINQSASPQFTAGWYPTLGAYGYELDVCESADFPAAEVTTYTLAGTDLTKTVAAGLTANTIYYYRVRAFNEFGNSAYSNTITVGLPEWISDAGLTYDQIEYDADNGRYVIKEYASLSAPLVLPEGELTRIHLNASLYGADGMPVIIGAGSGTRLELSGNSSAVGGTGAPAVDFSGASGASSVTVKDCVVSGGAGSYPTDPSNPGGSGGAGVLASDSTAFTLNGGSVYGGQGGSSNTGAGGAGGAGVSGGTVTVNDGTIAGGTGGGTQSGTPGAGGDAVSTAAGTVTVLDGTITGGTGGRSESGAGATGGAGVNAPSVSNAGAVIKGGAGGESRNGTGGVGGVGISAQTVVNSAGTVAGGDGGSTYNGTSGNGGTGAAASVSLANSAGATVRGGNSGRIYESTGTAGTAGAGGAAASGAGRRTGTGAYINGAAALMITTTTLTNAMVGENYSFTFTCTGGGQNVWSLYYGSLPDGLTLSGGGVLSGLPTRSGSFYIDVRVEDAAHAMTASNYFVLDIDTADPSADGNSISGLRDGQVFALGSDIDFGANGSGMANATPNTGDKRWLPAAWETNPSGDFTGGYSQSFSSEGMTLGGHTLTVTFVQQQYDGTEWVNTDPAVTDRKSVEFSLREAAIPATGDASRAWLWLCVSALALAGAAALALRKKRGSRA